MLRLVGVVLTGCVVAKGESSSSSEKVTVNGYVYGDNDFELYFNGKLVASDPYDMAPRQAVQVSFEAPKSGIYSFAIKLTDFGSLETGLNGDGMCIGNGAFRAVFDDGTLTTEDWKCYVTAHGPTNPEECFEDTEHGFVEDRFDASVCRFWDVDVDAGSDCNVEYYSFDSDWNKKNFDDSEWEYASSFTAEHSATVDIPIDTAFCERNGDGSSLGDPNCVDYSTVDWQGSLIIWSNDLDFDNGVLCRYSYHRGGDDSSSDSD